MLEKLKNIYSSISAIYWFWASLILFFINYIFPSVFSAQISHFLPSPFGIIEYIYIAGIAFFAFVSLISFSKNTNWFVKIINSGLFLFGFLIAVGMLFAMSAMSNH